MKNRYDSGKPAKERFYSDDGLRAALGGKYEALARLLEQAPIRLRRTGGVDAAGGLGGRLIGFSAPSYASNDAPVFGGIRTEDQNGLPVITGEGVWMQVVYRRPSRRAIHTAARTEDAVSLMRAVWTRAENNGWNKQCSIIAARTTP
jgi:hypothetical protein